jgi:tripartite ATP-independent transporter DctP family solute receptor
MKKIIALLLALVMIFALVACDNKETTGTTAPSTPSSTKAPGTETTAEPAGKDYGEYSADNPLELKLSHFAASDTNQLAKLPIKFEELVEARTGGAVDVVIYGGGVLGNDRVSLESVISGTLDMAANNTPIISNYYDLFQVLDLPYLFMDYDHINAFLTSDVCADLMNGLAEATGARMLCMQAVGFRNMDIIGKAVRTPADVAGLKIRVTDSPVYISQYEAWGANPQIIAAPETLTALQQKTIDGCDNVNNVQYSNRYYEFANHISITEHAVHFNGLTINETLFQSLPEDLRNDIMAAAIEAAVIRTDLLRQENEDQLGIMESEGAIVIRDIDKQSFIDATKDLYADFVANHSAGAYVARIEALKKK